MFLISILIHISPGTLPVEVSDVCQSCGVSPVWLLYLCIAFGILFLVMLVINVFLCSAMTCSCTKHSKEEKEASYLEDFDPYARSWQGSQYGSRFKTSPSLKVLKPTLKAPVLVFLVGFKVRSEHEHLAGTTLALSPTDQTALERFPPPSPLEALPAWTSGSQMTRRPCLVHQTTRPGTNNCL